MAINAKESCRSNPCAIVRNALHGIKERIRMLNSNQKKVFFGLMFFLIVNAVILVVSIIVFSMLLKKI